jgi:hypothetical protein
LAPNYCCLRTVCPAAHAAAPQIRLVIFYYALVRAGVRFVLRPMLAATKKLPLHPVNLNTATAFENPAGSRKY